MRRRLQQNVERAKKGFKRNFVQACNTITLKDGSTVSVALILAAAPLRRRSFMISMAAPTPRKVAAIINTVIPLCTKKEGSSFHTQGRG
jgi:hypothetical protein